MTLSGPSREMVLVVAGVLFALQLDDWNEVRKSREDAIYYLDLLHQQLMDEDELVGDLTDNEAKMKRTSNQ